MLKLRSIKRLVLMTLDFSLILVAYYLGIVFRFSFTEGEQINLSEFYLEYFGDFLVAAIVYILIFNLYRQYKNIWTMAGIEEFSKSVLAIITAGSINLAISFFQVPRVPIMVTVLAGISTLLLYNGVRIGWRVLRRVLIDIESRKNGNIKRILIVGAGSAGSLVINEFKKSSKIGKKVVALVDDDKEKRGSYLGGVKIIGTRHEIKHIVDEYKIDEIIIAIAHLDTNELKDLINISKRTKAQVKIMPGVSEMIDDKFTLNNVRDVDVKDLLGREPVKLDYTGITQYIQGKVIMVTGGGGSIGSELCRQIVKFSPKQIIIVDIYENNAYDIQNELIRNNPGISLKTLIASVRDKNRMREIFKEYGPDVVFHAAAHKHVPLMEDSPCEAIKNNVVGTLNMVELADEFSIDRFVLISTDKAVNPTNVMGATKRLCEMIIQATDAISKTEFVAVRFGNVLGSNGSVVPLFKRQIEEGGPVTLTHKEITRYFMLIPEAAQLVLQAGAYAEGGEIFVLDMGEPVKIYDLAENLIKLSGYEPGVDIKIEVTGLRPGEKLYEELLMSEEGLKETKHKMIFIGIPGEFELNEIKKSVSEIAKIANSGNNIAVREKLHQIVPTYITATNNKEVAITE